MSQIKLNKKNKELISDKLKLINNLHEEVIIKDLSAYYYDWTNLDKTLTLLITEYRLILGNCIRD